MLRFGSAWFPLLACALVSAQEPPGSTPLPLPTRVPLHVAADGGLWAAGDGWKASFGEGFVFHPFLGDAYPEGLPIGWRLRSVRTGDALLVSAGVAKAEVRGPARCEYDWGKVVERYDLIAAGVEQSFVIAAAPTTPGDLVVEGRFETRLHVERDPFAAGGLRFLDEEGVVIATYGRALAIDANGNELPVETELDGRVVRLRLSSEHAADASYPLVIDPLLGRIGLQMLNTVVRTDIGCDSSGVGHSTLLAMEVAVAANDHDLYVAIAQADLAQHTWAYHLLDATDHREPAVAFSTGANRWIVVYTEPTDRIVAYLHPRASQALNAGGAPIDLTWSGRDPDVGASTSPNVPEALVAYRAVGLTEDTIHAQVVDLVARTHSVPFEVSSVPAQFNYERRHPSVEQAASSNRWIVAWEENEVRPVRTFIRANQVFADHSIGQNATLSFGNLAGGYHVMRPQIAGAAGRFLACYLTGPNVDVDAADGIHVVRFDWPAFSAAPTILAQREHASVAGGTQSLGSLALAFDRDTRAHWCLLHRRASLFSSSLMVQRLGASGGVVHSLSVAPGAGATSVGGTSVTYESPRGRFALSYATNAASDPAYFDWLLYSASADVYGNSCGGNISTSITPNAGDDHFAIRLGGAVGATGALLLIGAQETNLSLAGLGAAGCVLLVDPSVLVTWPVSVIGGTASASIPLPDAPAFLGDAYCQWLVLVPGGNALGAKTSDGLVVHVR